MGGKTSFQLLVPKKLFGGSLQMILPSNFTNASKFRQIPDHQEVYVSQDSDASIIVEILDSMSEENDASHPLDGHFQVLAEDNSATSSLILQRNFDLNIVLGVQLVPKFGKKTDLVLILLSVRSIQAPYNADIVTSMNINLSSCAFLPATASFDLQTLASDASFKLVSEDALRVFSQICQSVEILDYSLFQIE